MHSGKSFEQFYGSNENGENAFGECVSDQTQSSSSQPASPNPESSQPHHPKPTFAQTCRAERKSNPAAFEAKFGTNKSKENALGKCVAAMAKAQASH